MQRDESGVFRVGGTRVTLDSVVAAWDQGADPEEIVSRYPSLLLSHVYAVLAWMLEHQREVRSYIDEQRVAADEERRAWEQRPATAALQERLRQLRYGA